MTSKEWIEQNPNISLEQIVNELIEWRGRAKKYQLELFRVQEQLAGMRHTKAIDVMNWVKLKPKEYYMNDELYGLIGTIEGVDGVLYIASTVIHPSATFTKNMIKDIIMLYKVRKICLITDVESKQGLIRRVLSRYNFTFKYVDGILYSTGGHDGNRSSNSSIS